MNSNNLFGITIGNSFTLTKSGDHAISIGTLAGGTNQQTAAIAIGYAAGATNQGTNAIAIGYSTAQSAQAPRSIAIGANITSAAALDGSFYATPVRSVTQIGALDYPLMYDPITKEVSSQPLTTMIVFNNTNLTTCSRQSVSYTFPMVIKTSDIQARLDAYTTNDQWYTFGPSVADTWVVGGGGSATTLAYSQNGSQSFVGLGNGVFTGSCNGLGYNGRIWLAVGGGTNTMGYSYDGITWIPNANSPFNSTGWGVSWNGKIWVAVGENSTPSLTTSTAWSYDGINWNLVTNVITRGYGIFWNGSIFVAVGTGNSRTIAWSEDGVSWSAATFGSGIPATGFANYGLAVSWSGSLWLALGGIGDTTTTPNNPTMLTSRDGKVWSVLPSFTNSQTTFGTSVTGFAISWNGQYFLAGGGFASGFRSIVKSSSNGLYYYTSNTITATTPFTFRCYGIYWNGEQFVTVGGSANPISWSIDGVSWNDLGAGSFGISGDTGRSVYFNSRRHHAIFFPRLITVMVGSSALNYGASWSSNGLTWTRATWSNTALQNGYGVAWNGSNWVMTGTGNGVFGFSQDGKIWTNYSGMYTGQGNGVAWGKDRFIAVGSFSDGSTNHTIVWSTGGISWQGLGNGVFSGSGFGIMYRKVWVAIGTTAANTGVVAYSVDGFTWQTVASTGTNLPSKIYNNGTMWIFSTQDGNMYYSYNAKNWTILSSKPFSSAANGLYWYNNTWVAVGNDSSFDIKYSVDGITWTGATGNIFNGNGNDLVYAGNRWIAVGNDSTSNVSLSADGVQWSNSGVSGDIFTGGSARAIACNQSIGNVYIQHPTLVLGSGTQSTILYSLDGISQYRPLGTNIFSTQGKSACWNGTIWVAVGQGTNHTMAWSADGITWNGLGTSIFSVSGNSVCWSGNLWVAVGEGSANTMAVSSDGKIWRGLGTNLFSVRGNGVFWNGAYFCAVGEGTAYTSATSTNGTNWTGQLYFAVGNAVHWATNYWIMVGQKTTTSNTVSIAYSTKNDASSWTDIANSATTYFSIGRTVAWNGTHFVAGGDAVSPGTAYTMAYAPSPPTSWTAVAGSQSIFTRCSGIAWNGIRFIAVGQNGANGAIAYAPIASGSWYTTVSPTFSNFMSSALGVASNPGIGFPRIDSQLVLDSFGSGLEGKLDVVGDLYYDQSYTNMTVQISANQLFK